MLAQLASSSVVDKESLDGTSLALQALPAKIDACTAKIAQGILTIMRTYRMYFNSHYHKDFHLQLSAESTLTPTPAAASESTISRAAPTDVNQGANIGYPVTPLR